MIIRNLETATHTVFTDHPHFKGEIDFLFEGPSDGAPTPQAFLVHQDPGFHLTAHYHLEDQFQVFVDGSGKIGSHEVERFMVHFASRESGYGPLVAGPDGLHYFSLRAITHRGVYALPETRDQMTAGLAKRQKTVSNVSANFGTHRTAALIERDGAGLAAWYVSAASDDLVDIPSGVEASGGRFYVFLAGSAVVNEHEVGTNSCAYFAAEDPQPAINAGPDGVELLVLQFPQSALVPRGAKA